MNIGVDIFYGFTLPYEQWEKSLDENYNTTFKIPPGSKIIIDFGSHGENDFKDVGIGFSLVHFYQYSDDLIFKELKPEENWDKEIKEFCHMNDLFLETPKMYVVVNCY